jgi:ATP-binding cassette, subfamily F, member 3
LAPLRKRLETLDARIEKLTGVIAKVDAALADGAFQKDAAKASELARMRAEAAAALASAEEEWLSVGAELEEAQA